MPPFPREQRHFPVASFGAPQKGQRCEGIGTAAALGLIFG
ncbi:MAG: hypothetical protein JWL77_2855, partial [Chthonomonadaceae bacterium]|nr:hypothetical protein [Chthonomonadaceae bacterium]